MDHDTSNDRNETAKIQTCVDANSALEGISTTNKWQVSATIFAMIHKNTVPVAKRKSPTQYKLGIESTETHDAMRGGGTPFLAKPDSVTLQILRRPA